jgi:prepilin-type N-terminal cleavage/methylation domain-containing protein
MNQWHCPDESTRQSPVLDCNTEDFMSVGTRHRNAGFSLIELVIVIVIIGIIAAIAIPRMSRGAAGAGDAALSANLAVLRNAIDLYHTEHGGTSADYPRVSTFSAQLTQYSNLGHGTSPTSGSGYIYGPYLREIPALPVGSRKGNIVVAATISGTAGWIYTESTGRIIAAADATELDGNGKRYDAY